MSEVWAVCPKLQHATTYTLLLLKTTFFSTYEYGDEYDAAEPLNIRNNRLINTRPDIILNWLIYTRLDIMLYSYSFVIIL